MLSHQVACQLNGIRHSLTKEIKDNLDDIQVRGAEMAADGPQANYHVEVIEYNAASDHYVVKQQDQVHSNATFLVSAADMKFNKGTPARCIGFCKAKECLNGKLCELHNFDCNTGEYGFCFEDTSVPSIAFSPENFHIVFELPQMD